MPKGNLNNMDNLNFKLEEKEILENKDLFNQIIISEKNIQKGKIEELKY